MTKAEMITKIAKNVGLSKSITRLVVQEFIDLMRTQVQAGESVYLRGFGTFSKKHRKKRWGRHIHHNRALVIPAREVVSFKPSPLFLEGGHPHPSAPTKLNLITRTNGQT